MKACQTCGRIMTTRKRWRGIEDEVKYCSARCRSNKPNRTDRALEDAILTTLDKRESGASMCPSEAAQQVAPENWKALMERARSAARRLVAAEKIQITQKGKPVDPSTAKGPIRLRKR